MDNKYTGKKMLNKRQTRTQYWKNESEKTERTRRVVERAIAWKPCAGSEFCRGTWPFTFIAQILRSEQGTGGGGGGAEETSAPKAPQHSPQYSFCWSIHLGLLSVCLSAGLSIFLLSFCLFSGLSICWLSVCLSAGMSVCLFSVVSMHGLPISLLSVCLSVVCPSAYCLSAYLLVCPSVYCLSVSLLVCPSFAWLSLFMLEFWITFCLLALGNIHSEI